MVRRQLLARGIDDPRVLQAMGELPRELFVEPHMRTEAYKDQALPIAEGQAISQPYMVAAMTQALRLGPSDRVLEIGTGSGYQAAVLACLAAWVVTVERKAFLAARARDRLAALGLRNVQVELSDGTLGFPAAAPFDAIVVTAEAPKLPVALLAQLAIGGRLVIPLAGQEGATLVRFCKTGDRDWRQEALMRCFFVPLVGQEGYLTDEGRG
ncbi:MAG: protein-L-isoaspartate(D-aspartate) O-methyltransferase [Candidatus Sericytochromatia bacterium]|nr:protein-L-isoaspartate(D-aspartate) O-methyltransferase [Candidatus Tanganyikabacteria bacterium]